MSISQTAWDALVTENIGLKERVEAQGREIAELKTWHAAGYAGQLESRLAAAERDRDDLQGRNSLLLATNYDLRKERDSWMSEAEMNAEAANQSADYAARLAITLELLRQHGIHVEKKWCWCEPTVEDHREGK